MSFTVSALPACKQNITPASNFSRPSANFHPGIWGESFIAYAADSMEIDDNIKQRAQALKEEVRKMLVSDIDNLPQKLSLIDTVQRLGVSYHFEYEIAEALQQIHSMYTNNEFVARNEDLHSLALLFRLLRQDGYRISSDVFKKFKDSEGNFNQKLTSDVRGMLSLYEAAQLRVHGEDILDEALDFTHTHLKSLTVQLSPLAAQVNHSLRYPLRKGLPRLEARSYMSFYQEDPSHNEILLLFAKVDFDILQKLHKKEAGYISKWWKDLDFSTKLPFARNRIMECYLWTIGVYFEPQYSLARKMTTKVIVLASIIDDIYDAYGTIEELQLFTDAIERWDISCLDYLPDYMKLCYEALLDIYEEIIEQEMTKEGRAFSVNYAKEEMKNLVRAYFIEAKWFNSNYIPTVSEYMSNATKSSGYSMVTTTSFVGMGDIATEKIFKWLKDHPKIIKALSVLCRVMNDIVSSEFEQNRGHAASVLECYMKQHNVSRQDAVDELRKLVVNAWKDINAECLRPTEVSMTFLLRIVNLARVMDAFYEDEDCYTNPGGAMKNYITTLLVDPVPI